jgi:hypothetical protein
MAQTKHPRPLDRRTLLQAGAALFMAPAASVLAGPARQARIIDLMPDFWRAWDAAQAKAGDEAGQGLMTGFFTPHADVYDGAGIRGVGPERIKGWMAHVGPHVPAMRRLSSTFRADFDRRLGRFLSEFRDFDPAAAPVYLMPSLGNFDAHSRRWRDVIPLFIGVDGIVFLHGDAPNLAVLLDHESFHLYQNQVNPALVFEDDGPVWASLWKEGLATYVSGELNPTASRLNVLLDDRRVAAAGPDVVRKAALEILNRLDSHAPPDHWRFFSYGYASDLPARTGYLTGMMVAGRARGGRTLAQMARLDPSSVRSTVETHLWALAHEGA